MLEWLAGVQRADGEHVISEGESPTCTDDAPNTPGPVFAARAFKQLIWGTPKPEEIDRLREQPRRHNSRSTGTVSLIKAAKAMEEDKSTEVRLQTPTKSPAKRPGILLTPGTGGTRRKTVSFERKPYNYQNGTAISVIPAPTPREIPGKFPTPCDPKGEDRISFRVDPNDTTGAVVTQSTFPHLQGKDDAFEDVTLDMARPRSTSGNYWKTEYESFSAKSALELRKLAKKEQVAKKYAKTKDTEAAKLTDLLQDEEKKVLHLQGQIENYVTQLSSIVRSNSDRRGSDHAQSRDDSIQKRRKNNECEIPTNVETTKASPLRSSTRQLEAALTNANATIESLRNKSRGLEAEVSRLKLECQSQQKELACLKNGNNTTRSTPHPQIRRKSRDIEEAQTPDLMSDIWADVGNDNEEPVTLSKRGQSSEKRRPLKPRNINATEKGLQVGKDSGLTNERREAARKRLEERRRTREKGADEAL